MSNTLIRRLWWNDHGAFACSAVGNTGCCTWYIWSVHFLTILLLPSCLATSASIVTSHWSLDPNSAERSTIEVMYCCLQLYFMSHRAVQSLPVVLSVHWYHPYLSVIAGAAHRRNFRNYYARLQQEDLNDQYTWQLQCAQLNRYAYYGYHAYAPVASNVTPPPPLPPMFAQPARASSARTTAVSCNSTAASIPTLLLVWSHLLLTTIWMEQMKTLPNIVASWVIPSCLTAVMWSRLRYMVPE